MLIELLIAITTGILAGIVTGLIPGIHVNLIAILALSLSPFIPLSPIAICTFIISLAITHSFLDSIPSIYLGAPDPDKALITLPGHKLLIKGLGHNAITYTLIGSLGSLILGLILIPLIIPAMILLQPLLKNYIGYILLIIILYLILSDKKPLYCLIAFLLSGILGIITFNLPMKQPLFPLLSGLFGFSLLLLSLDQTTIPKQKNKPLKLPNKEATKAISSSTFLGFIAAFLPGFGSSQAAIFANKICKSDSAKSESFLCLVGGINTSNMLISIATAFALTKARNGAIVAVLKLTEINFYTLLIFLAAALTTAGIATLLALFLSKKFALFISKVNYKKVIFSILIFTTSLVFIFDQLIGIIVLATATALGIFASQLNIGKSHLLGCLLLPVILFFLIPT